MQYTVLAVAALAAIMAPVNAFSVTNCVTGQYKNYGSGGNKKCQGFNTGNRVAYDSNKGYTLKVYSATDCKGQVFTTRVQNSCVSVPFNGLSVKAE